MRQNFHQQELNILQLRLEQPGFDLRGSTYTWTFNRVGVGAPHPCTVQGSPVFVNSATKTPVPPTSAKSLQLKGKANPRAGVALFLEKRLGTGV